MSTKTRSRLSIENKREIYEYARRHPNVKHSDMANYFNEKFNLTIDRSTVSKILLKKEKWLTNKQTSKNSNQSVNKVLMLTLVLVRYQYR